MSQDVKALIAVLALTLPVWLLARRLLPVLSGLEVFDRRRNVWVAVTVLGLLAPNIWLFALVAGPLVVWAGRRDPNPAALCILLYYAVPNVNIALPAVLVNQLFDISPQRILALALMWPALRRAPAPGSDAGRRPLDAMDGLLLAYLLLTLLLNIPYESATNTMRRLFLAVADLLLLFLLISRSGPRPGAVVDCVGAWVLTGLLLSAVSIFESVRGWLLYVPIGDRWGATNVFAFLLRDGSLRAQVSLGHSLTLGAWLAVSWVLFLYLQRGWQSRTLRLAAGALLLGGLWGTLSRGPWLTALLATVLYLALNPRGPAQAVKAIFGLVLVVALVLVSPFGKQVIEFLPFVGTVDSGNVDYRQQLFELSLTLIQQNPFFGSPSVEAQMGSLRQGQGIVDVINGYVRLALYYGLVGMGLFVALLAVAVRSGMTVWLQFRRRDEETAHLAAALVAAMLGTMFFIATAGIDPMVYMLAALLGSLHAAHRYAQRRPSVEAAAVARRVAVSR